MKKIIYGVDLSKKITPLLVRDAIFKCFISAHKEVLDMTDELANWKSKKERENFRNLKIELIIKNVFHEVGANYNKPSKEDLLKVLGGLVELASKFRNPEIVKKHQDEIMFLINKLK